MTIYFYGQNNPYGYFSNHYRCEFEISAKILRIEGIDHSIQVYSSEQAMMWLKALIMKDYKMAKIIENIVDPREAKKAGRKINNFDEELWDSWKEFIMCEILKQKFSRLDLQKLLLDTKNEILAEAAPNDIIWGIGINVIQGQNNFPWKGRNLLGKCLMHVRSEINEKLKKEKESPSNKRQRC